MTEVQFKYGDTWQFDYGLGDELKWGGNDIGDRDFELVVVDGAADCPVCKTELFLEIWVEKNRFKEVVPSSFRFSFAERTYKVVKP